MLLGVRAELNMHNKRQAGVPNMQTNPRVTHRVPDLATGIACSICSRVVSDSSGLFQRRKSPRRQQQKNPKLSYLSSDRAIGLGKLFRASYYAGLIFASCSTTQGAAGLLYANGMKSGLDPYHEVTAPDNSGMHVNYFLSR
jgi:hypothetical protein